LSVSDYSDTTSVITCGVCSALPAASIALAVNSTGASGAGRETSHWLKLGDSSRAYNARFDPSDSILSLSERLAKFGGGGTNCSIPLHEANTKFSKRAFAGCVLVSDNESWVGTGRYGSTGVMTEWQKFVKNQKRLGVTAPKLVCIDIQPYGSTQAPERDNILNIGGFSDAVFNVVASYLSDDAGRFVAEVESVEL
jgi:60 kDa SS-A/Ro ribonucleoprotein